MKKIYFLLLATILIASCKPGSKTNNRSEGKPVITVTLEPLRYLTEAIAGDRFTVVSMVPKGTSPETYDPTPQQLVELARSKAYFRIGYIGFEQTWTDKLTDNAPHLQFFDMSQGCGSDSMTTRMFIITQPSMKKKHQHAHRCVSPIYGTRPSTPKSSQAIFLSALYAISTKATKSFYHGTL